ncbi:hypothetical protein, partial [Bradyrhizobium japonicum]|uniref:hypothetical protein n=1 Tax=Bradyrhizobium japonicum TaxID=375 RepID=UPI0005A73C70
MPRPNARITHTHPDGRPVKITFGLMHETGVRGVLVYAIVDHVALDADRWLDHVPLSEVEPLLVC